ncbi:arf-GAP with GTPase, ANK repeat and PH domain-containing protein 3-like [Petaurus breviceps papuanus]|uniref:arf-GAP with GTPase, ANK repeat and PH domain-containing protein 3-like n=1 Tax=Petaurus breviceps papuanus TaxID=3040969 RepID=UPI0036DE3298
MNFQAGGGQSPQQQQSLAASGAGGGGGGGGGQFGGAGPGAGGAGGPSQQLAGGPPQQFALSNSAAIRAEIQRFESVHPNIYAIYDLIERIEDLGLQNQIREHVISIEESHPL